MQLLQNIAFLRLSYTQFFGALNDNIMRSAMVVYLTFILAAKYDWNPSILTNLALMLFILPFFLFSAWAGNLADSRDKSELTRRIKFIEIFIVALAGLGFWLENIWLLYFLLFCMGSQSSFFGPIKYGILPQLLAKRDLLIGNSYLESSTFLAILAGTLIGSYLITAANGVAIISALLLSVALLGYISSLKLPKLPPLQLGSSSQCSPSLSAASSAAREAVPAPATRAKNIFNNDETKAVRQRRWSVWLKTGFLAAITQQRHLLRFAYTYRLPKHPKPQSRLIWWICLSISWFWLVGAMYISQLPVIVKDILGAEAAVANLFLVLFTLGIGVGAALTKPLLEFGSNRLRFLARSNSNQSSRSSLPKTDADANRLWLAPLGHLGMGVATILLTIATFLQQAGLSKPWQQWKLWQNGQPVATAANLSANSLLQVGDFLLDPWGWLICFSLLAVTFFAGVYVVPLYTELISQVRQEHCGRIVAANNLCNAFFMVCGSLLAISFAALGLTSLHTLLLISGFANICLAFVSQRKLGRVS